MEISTLNFLEIKQKHKNVVRYQITVSVLLVATTVAGFVFDYFEKKNIIVMYNLGDLINEVI